MPRRARGSGTAARLRAGGYDTVAVSSDSGLDAGVDTLASAGLADALRGASVVIDVSSAPSFEPAQDLLLKIVGGG